MFRIKALEKCLEFNFVILLYCAKIVFANQPRFKDLLVTFERRIFVGKGIYLNSESLWYRMNYFPL